METTDAKRIDLAATLAVESALIDLERHPSLALYWYFRPSVGRFFGTVIAGSEPPGPRDGLPGFQLVCGERLLPSWTRDELRAHLDQFINTLPLMPTE